MTFENGRPEQVQELAARDLASVKTALYDLWAVGPPSRWTNWETQLLLDYDSSSTQLILPPPYQRTTFIDEITGEPWLSRTCQRWKEELDPRSLLKSTSRRT